MGLWTRVNSQEKSVLDHILLQESDSKAVKGMLIDEEKVWAPSRLIKEDKVVNEIFSDHNVIILEMNWI